MSSNVREAREEVGSQFQFSQANQNVQVIRVDVSESIVVEVQKSQSGVYWIEVREF
jgi:hypothetical protein